MKLLVLTINPSTVSSILNYLTISSPNVSLTTLTSVKNVAVCSNSASFNLVFNTLFGFYSFISFNKTYLSIGILKALKEFN
jgi:hypothetical protein